MIGKLQRASKKKLNNFPVSSSGLEREREYYQRDGDSKPIRFLSFPFRRGVGFSVRTRGGLCIK